LLAKSAVQQFMETSAEPLLGQPAAPNDAELCERIRGGDRSAFEQLMRDHNRTLFRTARAILRNDAEAEEAVQDAYLQAYRALADFRGEAKLSSWLVRIAANEALARRRKHVRRHELAPMVGLDGAAQARTLDGPRAQAERGELRRLIEAKIDSLPDALRSVFVLRAVEELSVEETAAALGIPPPTVKSRFFRARSRLRAALSSAIDVTLDDAFSFAGARCDRIVAGVLAAA
jgi:RNA polymerase sigma-70 factor (ECF subfamily)